MQQEWEESHKVTEELVEGPPTRRANATLTACPSGNFLWFIGGACSSTLLCLYVDKRLGELFSDEGKAVREGILS